jgi:hypothetical protein
MYSATEKFGVVTMSPDHLPLSEGGGCHTQTHCFLGGGLSEATVMKQVVVVKSDDSVLNCES